MRSTSRTLTTLGLCAVLLATPIAASAAPLDEKPPVSLAAIQSSAASLIAGRLSALQEARTAAASSSYLTDEHRAAILATLDADTAGLETLQSVVAADTDGASAAAHWAQIFTEYRVYAVGIPQSAYAAASDALTISALPALEESYTALSAALAVSTKTTSELESTLADMRAQLDAAARESTGIADAVLAVTPEEWNSDHAALADERAALGTATAAAAAAADDAAIIAEALQ